jgi:hypothetical protein
MSGKQNGFGSTLNKYPPGYGKSYFTTTNQAFFGNQRPQTAVDFTRTFDSNYHKESGGERRPIED